MAGFISDKQGAAVSWVCRSRDRKKQGSVGFRFSKPMDFLVAFLVRQIFTCKTGRSALVVVARGKRWLNTDE